MLRALALATLLVCCAALEAGAQSNSAAVSLGLRAVPLRAETRVALASTDRTAEVVASANLAGARETLMEAKAVLSAPGEPDRTLRVVHTRAGADPTSSPALRLLTDATPRDSRITLVVVVSPAF